MRLDVLIHSAALPVAARDARRAWARRESVLVRVEDGEHVAWGEASPLPGYSPDSVADCRRALEGLRGTELPPLDARLPPDELLQAWSALVSPALPAARCAIETAALDLLGRRLGRPAWALLRASAPPPSPLPLAALVGMAMERETVLAGAQRALGEGFRCLKVKIGAPERFYEELSTLRELRAAVGSTCSLRVDANGAFPIEAAGRYLEALAEVAPELVEEPVSSALLPRLASSPVPLAVDESLQPEDAWNRLSGWFAQGGCAAVVLKPMALGLRRCLDLADRARRMGLAVVVSHLFDGPIALSAAGHLALAVGSPDRAAGLGVHVGLSAWPPHPLPGFSGARLEAQPRPGLGIEGSALLS